MLELNQRYRLKDSVVIRLIGKDPPILMDCAKAEWVVFAGPTANSLVQRLNGSATLQEILNELAQDAGTAQKKVVDTIEKLFAQGFLERIDDRTTPA